LKCSGLPFEVSGAAGLTVYRIVQEALTNTLKHASSPDFVVVRLEFADPDLSVRVTDDGRAAVGVPVPVPASVAVAAGPVASAGTVTGSAAGGAARGAASGAASGGGGVDNGPGHGNATQNGNGVVPAPAGDRHGLTGMAERAAAFGGTLVAGPRATGGWEVIATLRDCKAPAPA
jgi:nitrate/nitrite-specific signal transduction histidine kinase